MWVISDKNTRASFFSITAEPIDNDTMNAIQAFYRRYWEGYLYTAVSSPQPHFWLHKCWERPCSRRVSKKCVYLLITIILTPLLTSTTFEMVASLLHQDTTEYNVMYPCNYQLHCLTISQYLILIVVAIYTVVPQHKRKLGRFWQLGKPSMSFPLWTIRHLPSSSAAVLLVAKYHNTQCN